MKTKILTVLALPVLSIAFISAAYAGSCNYSKASAVESKPDTVEAAISAGSFNTLVAALGEANLVQMLKGDGPFTVFAPTDEAFAKLPEGTLTDLLKPQNREKLKDILTYHVVPGKVMASDVVNLQLAKTVNGKNLSIDAGSNGVRIDNANVVKTDIETANGVIHIIDEVIIP